MPLGGRGLDLDLELELGEEEDNAGGGLMHCLMVLLAFVPSWTNGEGEAENRYAIFFLLF
jgi:hypothetical protein